MHKDPVLRVRHKVRSNSGGFFRLSDRLVCLRVVCRRSALIPHEPRRPASDTELYSVARFGCNGQPDRSLVDASRNVDPCDVALDAGNCSRRVVCLRRRSARLFHRLDDVLEDVNVRHLSSS